MVREAKYNFVDEQAILERSKTTRTTGYTANISGKYGKISFSMEYIRDRSLDGAFIKFAIDEDKKILGWRILREQDLRSMKGYRQVKVHRYKNQKGYTTASCTLMIRRLLTELKVKDESYLQLQIKTYKPKTAMLQDEYDLVKLKKIAKGEDPWDNDE